MSSILMYQRMARDNADKPAPVTSSSSSSRPSQSAPDSQATSQPTSAPEAEPRPKKMPVPISEEHLNERAAKKARFHGIDVDGKEEEFDKYAWDVVRRWDWPIPSELDREAKARVQREIDLIQKAKVLEQTYRGAARKRNNLKAEYKEAVKTRKDLRTKVKLEKKIALEEGVLKITAKDMEKLTVRYNESHELKWEGVKQQNLWDREKLTPKQRENKIAAWLKEKEEARKSKLNAASAPLAKQKGLVKDAAKKPQGIAKRTRAAKRPRAATPPPRSATLSPAPLAQGRQRKNPPNDQVRSVEDSEGGSEDPEAMQALLDKSRELIEENRLFGDPKPARKSTQRTGILRPQTVIPAKEWEKRKRQQEEQNRLEDLERQRKNEVLSQKLFPGEDSTEAVDTPLDSGYETGSITL